jgi:pimeloyl-ACP methyl ester carboxylesterase
VTVPAKRMRLCLVGSDGLVLRGDRRSPDGQEPRGEVVLLHGAGQTHHSWSKTSERLAACGWAVTAYDARGHGDSDWHPEGNYSMAALAEDLAAVIGSLAQRPVLVGASMGGVTALTALQHQPDAALGVALVDVVIELDPNGVERILSFMSAHAGGFDSLEEVAVAIESYRPTRARERRLEGLRKNVREREDGRYYWHWDPRIVTGPSSRANERRSLITDQITIPTLIIRGRESDVVSPEGVDDMLRRIPHATSVDVSGTGHMIAGDDNDRFARVLTDFLDRLAPESRTATDGHPQKVGTHMPVTMTAAEAVGTLGPLDHVLLPPGCSEAVAIQRELVAQRDRLAGMSIASGLLLGDYEFLEDAKYRYSTWHVMGPVRDRIASGDVSFFPIRASSVVSLFTDGHLPLDVVVVHVSSPDRHGFCSFGVSASYPMTVARVAPKVIALVNAKMPRVFGSARMHVSEFDILVEVDEPLIEYRGTAIDDISATIGTRLCRSVSAAFRRRCSSPSRRPAVVASRCGGWGLTASSHSSNRACSGPVHGQRS